MFVFILVSSAPSIVPKYRWPVSIDIFGVESYLGIKILIFLYYLVAIIYFNYLKSR